ncbi:oxygen-independent coproporphyrinogen III oxidase, Fe-S oxidoreductase [Syntrophus aciditrophicus SB]|uniref:Oxygen-independent coproporphyrinogen III oxidase, Fe-S oxidoreductase n=2 Tax=Syntrophus TaxID=43773 RepID=Q2LTK9_SYNAS|nr:oxygen-independent coproporphyrinogen III oxidase, Fe-S oxidoreductase [Syntrophus aciditrophicus SB]
MKGKQVTNIKTGAAMKYEGSIYRPPSEAYSLLIQVTTGCSHNKCTFCPLYKDKRFKIKSFQEIEEDIREAARYRSVGKVFLCDGDALIIPQKKLVPIFESINRNLRGVERIGLYGNAKSILRKTPDELVQLKNLGLKIVYLGVETGNSELLEKIRKGVTYSQLVEAGRKVKEAGILLSVTVLLGIGGVEKSMEHARDTARILSDIDPDYASALTLMMVPGTPIYDDFIQGKFVIPDQYGCLKEIGMILEQSNFTDCFFTSNHASNYLPVKARMPKEKEKVVRLIEEVIQKGQSSVLRSENMRAL